MNSYTGDVASRAYLNELTKTERAAFDTPVDPANLSRQAQRQLARDGITNVSRNAKCPCGSGKRFRKCHMKQRR